jgi:hypothetical protein
VFRIAHYISRGPGQVGYLVDRDKYKYYSARPLFKDLLEFIRSLIRRNFLPSVSN